MNDSRITESLEDISIDNNAVVLLFLWEPLVAAVRACCWIHHVGKTLVYHVMSQQERCIPNGVVWQYIHYLQITVEPIGSRQPDAIIP